jgi:hypothetical protein
MNKLSEFLDNEKARLIEEENFFTYHFLDITKEEWSEFEKEIDFVKATTEGSDSFNIMKSLGVNIILSKNGLKFLIRIKDLKRADFELGETWSIQTPIERTYFKKSIVDGQEVFLLEDETKPTKEKNPIDFNKIREELKDKI